MRIRTTRLHVSGTVTNAEAYRQIRGPSIDKQLRETYQGGVEGGTVARPVLILELVVRHERVCGCVERGRVRFVCGGHV
jgi:hypothetical protein